jgi:large conductance mechanosensitive channel
MSMMSEFKEFAMKGNVMDLAVGVIIGAAFGKIVDSLVGDVIMPLVSFVLGGEVDFSSFLIPLGEIPAGVPRSLEALKEAGVPVFAYGNFITVLINFLLLAFVIFMLVKGVNKLRRSEPPAPPAPPPAEEVLLAEIRDILRQQSR